MLKCLPSKNVRKNTKAVNGPSNETLNAILNFSRSLQKEKILDQPVLVNLN